MDHQWILTWASYIVFNILSEKVRQALMSRIECTYCLISTSYLAGLLDIFNMTDHAWTPSQLKSGVKQGCILVLTLFSIFMFTCSNCSRPCSQGLDSTVTAGVATQPQTNPWHNHHDSLLRLMDANNNNLTFSYYFIFDRIVCVLVTFNQWGRHFVMLIIRNLNLISIQSWTYLQTSTKRYAVVQIPLMSRIEIK